MKTILLALLVAVGCKQDTAKRPPDFVPDNLPAEVTGLSQRVTAVEQKVEHASRIALLLVERATLSAGDEIQIDPTSTGYALLKTAVGQLLVLEPRAEPYLDGYKLRLEIGNPTSAGIVQPTLQVRWPIGGGADVFDGGPERRPFATNASQTTQTLFPGSWTVVETILSPCSAVEIKSARLRVLVTNISLRHAPP